MEASAKTPALIETLIRKGTLKQDIYETTLQAFKTFKQVIREIVEENRDKVNLADKRISLEYRDKTDFEVEMKFAGDVLIFLMHTNIFEFSRDHEVMKTSYIREDANRSYCGMITIFNFLADSFKYNRMNDVGYMIGRIFVNKENHYFLEGKREVGRLYHNFSTSVLNMDSIREIVASAMLYSINFDLLTPPYDDMKLVTVSEMQVTIENMPLKTGKRLGFRFNADPD